MSSEDKLFIKSKAQEAVLSHQEELKKNLFLVKEDTDYLFPLLRAYDEKVNYLEGVAIANDKVVSDISDRLKLLSNDNSKLRDLLSKKTIELNNSKNSIKQTFHKLEREAMIEEREALSDEIDELHDIYNSLRKNFEEFKAENQLLKNQSSEASTFQTSIELERIRTEQELKINFLNQELEERDRLNIELRKEKDKNLIENKDKTQKIELLKKNIRQLESQIDEKRSHDLFSNDFIVKELKQKEEEIKKLKKISRENQKKISEAEQKYQESRLNYLETDNTLSLKKAEKEELETAYKMLEEKLMGVKHNEIKLKNKLQEFSNHMGTLNKLEAKETVYQQNEKNNLNLVSESHKIEIVKLKEHFTKKLKNLSNKFNQQKKTLLLKLDDEKKEKQKLRYELSDLQRELRQYIMRDGSANENHKIRDNLQNKESMILELKNKIVWLEEENQKLVNSNLELEKNTNEYVFSNNGNQTYEKNNIQLNGLRKELKESKRESSKLKREINRLNRQIIQNSRLEKQNKNIIEMKVEEKEKYFNEKEEKFKQEIIILKRQNKMSIENMNEILKEHENLSESIKQELEKTIKHYESKLGELNIENETLRERFQKFKYSLE